VIEFSDHALEMMAERGVTERDVEHALAHSTGPPRPGGRKDTLALTGLAEEGRPLIVVRSKHDWKIVTTYWERE
jgi:hypothetical protein